ncbi:MAG: metallophosphoesterase family protein [Litorimonas sp.]
MLKSLFRKKSVETRPAAMPEGQCAYVVGDIHGCLDPLMRLLSRIGRHAVEYHPQDDVTLVFVGDLIDRGPQSAQVVETLLNFEPMGMKPVFLMGNHEEIFLKALGGSVDAMSRWFDWGGRATARSYGVDNLGDMHMAPERVMQKLIDCVPEAHEDFIRGFQSHLIMGDYIFVHAGLRPKVELDAQTDRDMRWIREDFLNYRGAFPHKVVHGHSIVPEAENRANRIAVDTGVYKEGGALTAVCLSGTKVEFLSEPSEL